MIFSKFKIRNKIALLSILQFILVIIVIGFILNIFISRLINKNIENSLSDITQSRVSHIETYFNDNIQLLKLVTSRTALRMTLAHHNETSDEVDIVTLTNIIRDAISSVPAFERICLLGLDGKVLSSTNEKYFGKDVSTTKFFINGQEREGVYFVEDEGIYRIYISGPIQLEGRLLGVGMTVLKLDYLEGIIRQRVGLGNSGEVLVAFLDNNGERKYPFKRLFEEGVVAERLESDDTAFPMKQALIGNNDYFPDTLDYRNKEVIAVSGFVKIANLGLVAKVDKSEAFSISRKLFWLLSLIIIIFIILYYLLSKNIAKIISRPITELYHGIEKIEKGDLDYKVGTNVQDEIGQLSRSFDNMIENLKKSRLEIDKKIEDQTKDLRSKTKDLTDQKDAILNILEDVEKEKNKAEELASVIKNSNESIVSQTTDGVIISWNKGAENLYGYSEKEMVGESIKIIIPEEEEEELDNLLKEVSLDKKIERYQTVRKKKDGSLVDVSLSISPVKDVDENIVGVSVITIDITKEKAVDKAKTEFVSLASHQLRTPLSSINWYTEMLLNEDVGKINEDQKKYLLEVYVGSQRMVELVNSLLNVSRLDLGTFVINPVQVEVPKIVKSLLEELKPQIKEKKQRVDEAYDNNLRLFSADESLLRMVLQNLLSNAVKYTPVSGFINIGVNIVKAGETFGGRKMRGDNFTFTVADSGMGIPKSQQDRVFLKLFRADNAKQFETEGTGLGLYIIKSIVDQAGGEVWFESEENKGTAFYVSFPIQGMKKKDGLKQLD